ncbi:hypothetical protein DPMN_100923 [Dreissena polymorpha]|uniref:Uncharacterized protein n=1 Tax=Dreissena polymorpha TaxID=45954 RepID=A0A9D4R7V6_DREPO|nr:hypothetical protein DPMN_100923 [Dreissena polymorpha]
MAPSLSYLESLRSKVLESKTTRQRQQNKRYFSIDDEIEALYQTKILCCQMPRALLKTMWYNY